MSDITRIKNQLGTIKKLVKQDKEHNRKTITKLEGQLKNISSLLTNLDSMAKNIKIGGSTTKFLKGGGCPFVVEKKGGKKKRKKVKKKRSKKKIRRSRK